MLARPGTRGPSILHESTSKSAIRDPQDIPGRRITARVDLDRSRALESLPGAPFFQGTFHFFPEKHIFCWEKTAGGNRLPDTRSQSRHPMSVQTPDVSPGIRCHSRHPMSVQTPVVSPDSQIPSPVPGGRREAKIRVFPKMSPEPPGDSGGAPGASGGALGAPKGPKKNGGAHGALGAPMSPRCAAGLARSALYSCTPTARDCAKRSLRMFSGTVPCLSSVPT